MEESLEELVRRAREGDGESLDAPRLRHSRSDLRPGLADALASRGCPRRDPGDPDPSRHPPRDLSRGELLLDLAHRVAANYLLSARKSRLEQQGYTFQRFGDDLDEGLSDVAAVPATGETALLLEEVRVGLHPRHADVPRPAASPGVHPREILEMEGEEAARVLAIRPAAFRNGFRGPRGHRGLHAGQVRVGQPERPCPVPSSCRPSGRLRRVDPRRLLFCHGRRWRAALPRGAGGDPPARGYPASGALFRSHPPFAPPADFAAQIRKLVGVPPDGS